MGGNIGDIAGDCDGLGTKRIQLRYRCGHFVIGSRCIDPDGLADGSERQRNPFADPPVRPGDEGCAMWLRCHIAYRPLGA